MRVLGDKVLVEVATSEEKTASGIILTSVKAERNYEGIVIAVGDNEDIAKIGVKPGDYVYYVKGMNVELVKEDKTYDILSIYDIVGKRE